MTFQSFLAAVDAGDGDIALTEIDRQPAFCDRRDESGIRALMRARYNGHHELAQHLAEASKPLDIFEASAIGDQDRIKEILSASQTDVNAVSPDGFPPLALASFFGNLEVVHQLLEHQADPNRVAQNPSTVRPIHSAVANRDDTTAVQTAQLLLEAGADPNIGQTGGYTPLHSAAAHGRAVMVDLLLQFNAASDTFCDDGQTPAVMARNNGHDLIAEQLDQHSR